MSEKICVTDLWHLRSQRVFPLGAPNIWGQQHVTRGAAYISSLRGDRRTLNPDELFPCQLCILKQGPHSPSDLTQPFFRSAMFLLFSKVILKISMSFQKVPKTWGRQPATAVLLGISLARVQHRTQGWSAGLWEGDRSLAGVPQFGTLLTQNLFSITCLALVAKFAEALGRKLWTFS